MEHTANNNKHNILDSSGFVVSPPISAHREKNNTKMFFLHISGDNERLEDVTSPAESHETVKQVALLIRTMLDDLLMKAARRRENFYRISRRKISKLILTPKGGIAKVGPLQSDDN